MESAVIGAALSLTAAHAVVLAAAYMRRDATREGSFWILLSVALAGLVCLTYVIPVDATLGGATLRVLSTLVLSGAALAAFGGAVIRDMGGADRSPRLLRGWLAINVGWVSLAVVLWLVNDPAVLLLGETGWLVELLRQFNPGGMVALFGLVGASVFLIGFGLQRFYVASLPEVANRALYWVLNATVLLQALVLLITGTESIAALGMAVLLVASIGVVHGATYFHVFDIRSALILALRSLFFVAISAAMVFLALYLALTTGLDAENAEGLLIMGLVALLVAALSVPVRHGIEYLIHQVTYRRRINPTPATREFSRHVSEATELKTLMSNAIQTLNHVFQVRRSAIILLTSTHRVKDAVELQVMQPEGEQDGMKGLLSVYSPIYDALAAHHEAITQFDLDYNPRFAEAGADERRFFASLQMSAYAPIVMETTLIGILAAGPKLDDTAFFPDDRELLTTLAQQTAIALRNARHVDDLQHLYKSMQSLYSGLKSANDELNKMDAVKSDFVTIASHELRTPLAQLRGYTDILDALNDQGMLDRDQTVGLVANLRKATERMEELISAMLDVSQLDVNAMDLRLTATPLESVIRMAIEPLADAINQRKIALTSRGLRGLPPIQADLPRLVQAFRNVIVNAIKFTPDGGRIDIVASVENASSELEGDHIRVEIRDTGVGIDKKNLELVFKKFFRAYDPSLHSTGTYKFLGAGPGLGLTIARGVIEGHGGHIWAESEGHDMDNFPGTTFVIRLPVSTPDDARRRLSFEGEMPPHEPTSQLNMPVASQQDNKPSEVVGD